MKQNGGIISDLLYKICYVFKHFLCYSKAIADAIHPDAKYRSVAYVRLVGMQLEVLVNNNHYKFVKNVAIDTVGTGILGKMVDLFCLDNFVVL